MINIKTILPLALLLTGAAGLLTGEALALSEEEALNLALERNVSLRAGRLDREEARETAAASWNNFLPGLNAQAGISRTEQLSDPAAPGASDDWSVNGSLSAEKSLSASTFLAVGTDRLALELQELQYAAEKSRLTGQVKKRYSYLLAHRENLELQRKNLELARKRYDQTEKNYENGLASELSVLEARNSYESLRPAYTGARTSYETQLMAFKALLGLNLEQEIRLTGSLNVEVLDFDGAALMDALMMNRFDIRIARKNREIRENAETLAEAAQRSPALSLKGDWNRSAGDLTDPDWQDSLTLSLTLRMPLEGFIPGSSADLTIRSARRQSEKTELTLEETILAAEEEVRTVLMTLEGARETMEITAFSVELAERTYGMTEEAFRQGTKEILDVEGAQNKLLTARQDLIMSRYDYLAGLLDLETALNADRRTIRTAAGTGTQGETTP